MGGCRCSYRSCKVRSDGETHMFHFPVFDKMRCHQWISNAYKPDFFNLKISQLKNRVICQHHFKDEHFMNFLRDKLKSTAIPTEDGPYCSSNHMDMVNAEPNHPVIPINPEDIENDMLNCLEKKAHFSVKYSDYLTSDVTEKFNSSQPNIESIEYPVLNTQNYICRIDMYDKKGGSYRKLGNSSEKNKYAINYKDTLESTEILFSKKGDLISTAVSIEFEEQPTANKPEASQSQEGSLNAAKNQNAQINNPVKSDKMVKIESGSISSEPLKFVDRVQSATASTIILKRPLRMLKSQEKSARLKHSEIEPNNSTKSIDKSQLTEVNYLVETVPIEFTPEQTPALHQNKQENQPHLVDSSIKNQNNQDNVASKENDPSQSLNYVLRDAEASKKYGTKAEKDPKTVATSNRSILKSKVTPEKLAAIDEKRKFNMKLRDVITSCLNNMDEQNHNKNITQEVKQAKKKVKIIEPTIPPSSQSNVIAYLESRLQKMEDTLLNKIENNTNRINELKRTVKPTASNKKSVNTQTYINHMTERSQKEYLYKEISKFLSPSANIKIYEELFIENNEEDIGEPNPRKLRKRR